MKKKKPSPDIYLLAKDTLGLEPARTVVIEDSEIGLAAAKAAGMKCVVTKSSYTKEEVGELRVFASFLGFGFVIDGERGGDVLSFLLHRHTHTPQRQDFAKADKILEELGDGPGGIAFDELAKLARQ